MSAVPATLRAAAGLAAVENTVLLAALIGWTDRRPLLLLAALAFKYALCWWTVHLRHGAALGLMLWELSIIVAMLSAEGLAGPLRTLGGASAVIVLVALGRSLHAFPAPTLPRRSEGGPPPR